MVDEIKVATTALKDLNASAKAGEKIFDGLGGKIIEVASATEGAGKAWTTFGRLTSGTGIWRFQNKLRAYLTILGSFQVRALAAEKAQREQNKATVDSIVAVEKMNKEMDDLWNANGKYNDQQKETLRTTDAYTASILAGKNENEAFAESLFDIIDLHKANRKAVKLGLAERKKAAKFEERLKTVKGRGILKTGIEVQKQQVYKKLTGDKSIKAERNSLGGFGKALKSVFGLKQRKKADIQLIKLLQDSNSLGDAFSTLIEELPKIAKNSAITKKILATMSTVRLATSKLAIVFYKKLLSFSLRAAPLLSMAYKVFVYMILGIVLFMVFAKVAYDIFGIIKDMGVIDDITTVLTEGISIASSIFGIASALINGDFKKMFDYLNDILDSTLVIIWNVALAAAKTGFGILVGIFYSLIDFMEYFFIKEGWKVVLPALLKIGKILLIAYFVKYLISQALLVIALYAFPLLIVVLIGAFIMAFWRDNIVSVFTGLHNIAVKIKDALTDDPDKGWWDAGLGPMLGFADGGVTKGGISLVGERGPEIVRMPTGSRVHSNTESKQMLKGSGGVTNNFNITVNAKDTSDAEMRRMAEQLGKMIGNKMNRMTSARGLL